MGSNEAPVLALVSVTAPYGTLHESFFDPVQIGDGVGFDQDNGALKSRAFITEDGDMVQIDRLVWEPTAGGAGKIFLQAWSDVELNLKVEFIRQDGQVSTLLYNNLGSPHVAWTIEDQPWEAGDKLMLRVSRYQPTTRG